MPYNYLSLVLYEQRRCDLDQNPKIFDVVLLLALPASGKSEVRRYLRHVSADVRARDFHIGEMVQLDDFPYVHVMRRIDEELVKLGHETIFFPSPEKPFKDPRDWLTLIHLLNEDFVDLQVLIDDSPLPQKRLFARLERAGILVGIGPRLSLLPEGILYSVMGALASEAEKIHKAKQKNCFASLEGKTVIIEFSRGGPAGAAMPLPEPLGYYHSLENLLPAIYDKAVILYIEVTPEESRRKNLARANPDDPGSILQHCVPEEVMMNDYGCDDAGWLKDSVPIAMFDNHDDKTSFLQGDPVTWKAEDVAKVHEELKKAMDELELMTAELG